MLMLNKGDMVSKAPEQHNTKVTEDKDLAHNLKVLVNNTVGTVGKNPILQINVSMGNALLVDPVDAKDIKIKSAGTRTTANLRSPHVLT